MSAVVSLLWGKNADALRGLLNGDSSTLYVGANPHAYEGFEGVRRVEALGAALPQDVRQSIALDAKDRAQTIGSQVAVRAEDQTTAAVLTRHLESRLRDGMLLVAALDHAHERDGVDLLVLNEDVTQQGKTAAAWAKARKVPSVLVSHSCILGRMYTVHRQANTDRIAVFGRRGADPYIEMGVPMDRMIVTGNPAWDVYAKLLPHRDALRAELAARYGFPPSDHLVVFAPTWTAYLTAFCDPAAYESSLRAVLHAAGALRRERVPLRVVIKDRPMNRDGERLCRQIAREEAIEGAVVFTYEDTEKWIVSADAVVSVDSNISIEAAIAGVPAINLWTPMRLAERTVFRRRRRRA